MKLRFPDKPFESHKSTIKDFDTNQYIAQSKLDGYRTFVIKNKNHSIIKQYNGTNISKGDNLFFLSRRGINKGGPTDIPVKQEIINVIDSLNLPDNTMLDCEWLCRRTIGECPEKLFIFDVIWLNDEWIGKKPFIDRNKILLDLINKKLCDCVGIPDSTSTNFEEFFETQTKIPWTEGIVLKHHTSTIIGDNLECKKNPLIIKIKWRGSSDGRQPIKDIEDRSVYP